MNKNQNYPKIEEFIKKAGELTADLEDDMRRSLPIPVLSQSRKKILFLFCSSSLTPWIGATMLAPTMKLEIDFESAESKGLQNFVAAQYGLKNDRGTILGLHKPWKGASAHEYKRQEATMYRLYNLLLNEFFHEKKSKTDLKLDCVEFLDLFHSLSEEPLATYYETIGKFFFDWVKSCAAI